MAVTRKFAMAWVRRLVLLAVAVVATITIFRLVGQVDWHAVWHSFGQLHWWQAPILLVVLVIRQILNASPLSFYIRDVSIYRATVNDLSASSLSVVAPPPSDMALRIAMFKSWGVPISEALAGTTMNTLTFYIVRFGTPVPGAVLVAVAGRSMGLRWLDVVSVLTSAAVLTGVLLVVRSDAWARSVGTYAGQLVRRFRHTVEPRKWSANCAQFREDIASRFTYAFPRSVTVTFAMVVVDMFLLTLALRFVGVGPSDASLLDIAIAFAFAYPFTVFPMSGMGLVDALVVAAVVESGGHAVEQATVAGLLVWRVCTIAGPFLLGLVATALWRRAGVADAD